MSTEVEDALSDRPWSVTGTFYGIDRVKDDEGRPLGERRSPSDVKVGVEILLEACPYRDERRGKTMNASALSQVARHWKGALNDFQRFRACFGENASWQTVLMVAIDALSEPARQVLEARSLDQVVTARAAVRHKLAAGYMGVLREIMYAEATGASVDVDVETLLEWVKTTRSLIGRSEVCAGPPAMIRTASAAMIEYAKDVTPDASPKRRRFAELASQQVRIGVAWELYDLWWELSFFSRHGADALGTRNDFMRGRLERRRRELCAEPLRGRATRTPKIPGVSSVASRLRRVLADNVPTPAEAAPLIIEANAFGDGAIQFRDASALARIARELPAYVTVYREVLRAQWSIERELRELLGFSAAPPLKPNSVIVSSPRWLDWIESAIGHRLKIGSAPDDAVCLVNHRRTLSWLPAA